MQTLATFDEKLATILIKELTTTSQTISVHRTAFDNLRFFGHGINRTSVMKSESVVHNAATQALILSVAGVTAIVLMASLILLILY